MYTSKSPASGLISSDVMLPPQLYNSVSSLSAVLLQPPEREMFCQMVWEVILTSKPALPCQPRPQLTFHLALHPALSSVDFCCS